jgi:hypothetical protein
VQPEIKIASGRQPGSKHADQDDDHRNRDKGRDHYPVASNYGAASHLKNVDRLSFGRINPAPP